MTDGYERARARRTYHDRTVKMPAVKVAPGELYVTAESIVLVAVLGACVCVCLRDTVNAIGGMNHFMLPYEIAAARDDSSQRYGLQFLETLVDSMLQIGASETSLEARVYGADNVMRRPDRGNVGKRNAEFVLEFLGSRKIPVVTQDLGDSHPCKVWFFPRTGMARVTKLPVSHGFAIHQRELEYNARISRMLKQGDDGVID